MKFKVGDRVKSEKFGEGTVVETGIGLYEDQVLVQFDKSDLSLHGGDEYSKYGPYKDNTCWYYLEDDTEIKKINQFTKSDLRDGDKCTLKNGKVLFYGGDKEYESSYSFSSLENDLSFEYNDEVSIIKVERPVKYETVFERKEEILDEVEKEYLKQVIRPFRNKVRLIEKEDNGTIARIKICLDYHFMFFPALDKDKKMYEGMQSNRAYSLKELGL